MGHTRTQEVTLARFLHIIKKENVHFFFFVPGDSNREPEERNTNEKKSKMITFSRKVHHE